MNDLAGWLLEQIAADERIARAAIADDGGETEGLSGQRDWLTGRSTRVNSPRFGDALADLTATFAVPARVLAECEAKRRIVELHSMVDPSYCFEGRTYCSGCQDVGDEYPCDTLRLLAAPYADREGYVASAEAIDRFVAARTETARIVAREAWDRAAVELHRKAEES